MESLNLKLQNIYNRLQKTSLVITKEPTVENITEFKTQLNNLDIETEYELAVRDFVRTLESKGVFAFSKYLSIIKSKALVLLTMGGMIAHEFELNGIVYIRWGQRDNCFMVKEFVEREKSQKTRGRGVARGRGGRTHNPRKTLGEVNDTRSSVKNTKGDISDTKSGGPKSPKYDGATEANYTNAVTKLAENEKKEFTVVESIGSWADDE